MIFLISIRFAMICFSDYYKTLILLLKVQWKKKLN